MGNAERVARLPGLQIDADQAQRESEEQTHQAAQRRGAEHRGDSREGDQDQREILRGTETQGDLGQRRRGHGQPHYTERAGHERTDGGGRQRRGRPSGLCHLMAVDGGDHGAALAGRIHEDRRGRSAVHGAGVYAGKHDERPYGSDLKGDRQQQGDGQGGSDAGKDADDGAQHDPDERPQEVPVLEDDRESLQERRGRFHLTGR